jgi:hypothetical protein
MRRWELPNDGLERYSTRRVVFARPFTLGKAPEVYPAGAYQIETKEQELEAGGHTAHVRTSTLLIIPTPTGTCCREVRASDLDQALLDDAAQASPGEPGEIPHGRDTGAEVAR